MNLSPYPLYYCPPGVARPAHCPHIHIHGAVPEAAPDGAAGTVFGGPALPADRERWVQHPAGWWLLPGAHRPQDLVRLETSPRIQRWYLVQGALPSHWWRVPVLLTPADPKDPGNPDKGSVSALDRIRHRGGWSAPEALRSAQERLLAVTLGYELAGTLEERNAAVVALAVDLLGLGHHVTEFELDTYGWLTESLVDRVLIAAAERTDALAPSEVLRLDAAG